jgi:hypothetical protein
MLGWADVERVSPGVDLGTVSLEPVVSAGRVLRVDIPGTEEYYLLENRQRLGFDGAIRPGLLVWHVDADQVASRWASNRVNGDPARLGVALVQPDGEYDLEEARNRGDGGDVFPGATDRRAFHAGTVPASVSRDGVLSGLTLLGLDDAAPTLRFRLLTRFQSVSATTTGDGGTPGMVVLNGEPLPAGGGSAPFAPFQDVIVAASPGVGQAPGVRTPFLGWSDGVADTLRSFVMPLSDTAFVAEYGGRQVQVAVELQGGAFGVPPGSVASEPASPGLWFVEGTAVTLEAIPTPGFSFTGWEGELSGAPNPVGLVVESPTFAQALFEFEFEARDPEPLVVVAGDAVQLTLTASEASEPIRWSVVEGALPAGLLLGDDGVITGSATEHGSFQATIQARDALGLQGSLVLEVDVAIPELPLEAMASDLLADAETGTLKAGQAAFLDRAGNRNGRVDVGDIRIYLTSLRTQGTRPPAEATVRVIPVRLGGGS